MAKSEKSKQKPRTAKKPGGGIKPAQPKPVKPIKQKKPKSQGKY